MASKGRAIVRYLLSIRDGRRSAAGLAACGKILPRGLRLVPNPKRQSR
jgi:hypothetical protein